LEVDIGNGKSGDSIFPPRCAFKDLHASRKLVEAKTTAEADFWQAEVVEEILEAFNGLFFAVKPPSRLADIGLDRLESAGRGETLFIVAPDDPTDALLERLSDARKSGATLLTMDRGDDDLAGLAHDQLIVPATGLISISGEPLTSDPSMTSLPLFTSPSASTPPINPMTEMELVTPAMSFDTVQHLVSAAAGEAPEGSANSRRSFRDRLGRMLDSIQGAPPPSDW
jgi:hypothetical protein